MTWVVTGRSQKKCNFLLALCANDLVNSVYISCLFSPALSPVLQNSHFVAATMLMLFSPSFWMDFNRLLSIRFSSFGKREGGVHFWCSWWTFQNVAWPLFFNFVSIQKWCSLKYSSNNISLFLLCLLVSQTKSSCCSSFHFVSIRVFIRVKYHLGWPWWVGTRQESRRKAKEGKSRRNLRIFLGKILLLAIIVFCYILSHIIQGTKMEIRRP